MILVWDNVNIHVSVKMRAFIDAHADWLTVVRLPAHAPDLNAAERVWAHLKHGLGNLAANGIGPLTDIVKTRLKRIQYRPEFLEGFLTQTGLTLEAAQP
jgi:transposase